MSRISYFQRFSQRENHATNNTLLIMRSFYETSPFKVQRLLNSLTEEECSIGLNFEQQVSEVVSVPDALISQDPLRIYIETKRGDSLDVDQIQRHVAGIAANPQSHGTSILIGLTKEPIAKEAEEFLKSFAKDNGVIFAATTFSAIVDALQQQCEAFERDLTALVEDFEQYLSEEGLLEERNQWLPIFPCGSSHEENQNFDLYYEPASRPCKRNYRFIGLYWQKSIRLIGEIRAIVRYESRDGRWEAELGQLTEDFRERIERVISEGSHIDTDPESKRFYLVDRFINTNVQKATSGGIMGMRYLDMRKLCPKFDPKAAYSTDQLAELLSGATFD